jgi:hypothetical protein
MLRGFATTLAVVSAITLVAWSYADQARMARATPIAEITPAATSMTTNSNLAAKGDKLDTGVRLSGASGADTDGAIDRIIGAHLVARDMAANAKFVTVASAGVVANETVLTRVPVED